MPGFANYGQVVDAVLNGQSRYCSFRKVPSQASVANWWVDLSMAGGNPPPNYYASSPLVAATLETQRGILHGFGVGSDKALYLARLHLQTPTAGLVGAYRLLDYLLYYPFIDGDDTDVQTMDNTVTLPRYVSGAGVQAMMVCVAPTTGNGTFTFDYINQDGVQKTSAVHSYTPTASSIASLLTSQPAGAAGHGPFLRLNGGDTGIRSIVSVQNLVANGGLATIVLVRPLADASISEINTPSEYEYARGPRLSERIYDGAYLGLIMNCAATVAAGTLTGFAHFVWN